MRSHYKKIPTLLGIFILFAGIASGVVLTNAKQIFKLGAKEDSTPKNVRFSNIEDETLSVSFTTDSESRASVKIAEDKYFLKPTGAYKEDVKSTTHYFNIEGLTAEQTYYLVVNVDGVDYFNDNPKTVKTGRKLVAGSNGEIIYGKVYSKSGQEQNGAIVYAQYGNSSILSTQTSDNGDFILNISKARTTDLSSYILTNPQTTTVQLLVQHDGMVSSVSTYVKNARPLPPIILGNNLDARNIQSTTNTAEIPTPSVYGASDSNDLPFSIKNIFKERFPN